MVFFKRAAGNLLRRRVRTVGIALVIGLIVAGFLTFYQIGEEIGRNVAATNSKLTDLALVTDSTSEADPLTNPSLVSEIQAVPGVVSVQRAGIVLPTQSSGGLISPEEAIDVTAQGTILSFTCIEDTIAGCPITITSGRALTPSDQQSDVALQTQAYASANDLSVGSVEDAGGTSFTLVGLYSTGESSDVTGTLIIPYPAAAAALGISNPSRIYVTVQGSSSLAGVVASLESKLGSSYAIQGISSIASGTDQALNGVASSAQLEAYLALAGGASVMALVMVLVTSSRVREVGLLKALGFSGGKIAAQVTLESLLWSSLGLPLGLGISVWIGPVIAPLILGSAAQSGAIVDNRVAANPLGIVSFSLSLDILVLAVLVTLAIAMAGALYPVIRSIRMRPAEALREY